MRRSPMVARWTIPTLAVALAGCAGSPAPAPVIPVAAVKPALPFNAATYIDQGWTPELTRKWYWTPQGSRLVPYDWYAALEKIGNDQPFGSDDLIERFGYLASPKGADNPDGLPIGFAKSPDEKGRDWLGFTCAACHTGQIEYQGKKIRIEGGPTLGDLAPFRDEMIGALQVTLKDDAKFARFAAKVLGGNPPPADRAKALREEVQTFLKGMIALADRSRPAVAEGPGRVDAFTILMNEVLGTVAGEPKNYRPPVAPVSYPPVWLAPRLDWVQWNGAVQNAIARNDGEVLIVFGHAEAVGEGKDVVVRSTGMIKNLIELEDWTKTLKAPAWPEAALGPIDAEKARRGGEIYRKVGCATCHADKPPYPETAPNKFGKTFVKVARVPLSDVKTDPVMAENFLSRTALTGKFSALFGGQGEVPAWQMVYMGLVKLVEGDLPAAGLTPEQMLEAGGFRETVIPSESDLRGYKTGPLAGVWATAPYLHNGSVPSLYQLLLPPERRVKVFHVGGREFDPKHVGYESAEAPGRFEFRSEVPGNSNSGHAYGTDLPDEDRWALVEYLKTL